MKLLIAMNLFIAALRKIISKTPIEDGAFSNLKIVILLGSLTGSFYLVLGDWLVILYLPLKC